MNAVAKEILAQLGGSNKLVVMTGAKNFVYDESSVRFDLPKLAKNKSNKVQIVLGADDLYTVRFFRYAKLNLNLVSEFKQVDCENLMGLFERETGLVVCF